MNCMKANPDKCQAILLNYATEGHCLYLNYCSIERSEEVTLLGMRLVNQLVFNHQTNELSKKTGREVNALKRLCFSHQSRYEGNRFQSFYLEQFSVGPTAQQYAAIACYRSLKN